MTWLEKGSGESPAAYPSRSAGLRLVGDGGPALPDEGEDGRWVRMPGPPAAAVPVRRRVSPNVRRRRTLGTVMGALLVALALPLSGTGGHSHPTGSALAETGGRSVYTVQPGDSLWSIAERMDPSADPRPMIARLASRTGSDTVVPGERIVLP